MRSWVTWLLVVVAVAAVAIVVVPFVYINVVRDDAPARFACGTADDASAGSTSTVESGDVSVDGVDGTWVVADGSEVGYRVVEVLFGQDTEGVGRTSSVSGQLVVADGRVTDGAFAADLTAVESDEARRDDQFDGRLMDTAAFPTATFALTEPVDLDDIADGGRGTASGDLTLRGSTRPATVDLEACAVGDSFRIVGSTDVVFADFGIPQPDVPGITTRDHGLLELDLRLARSG